MKLFIPFAEDEEQAARVYDAIRKFAEESTGWQITDRKILSLSYVHDGKEYHAEVGKPEQVTGEVVIAILESNTYLVCTPNRGVVRGIPILVGKHEVRSRVDFE